MAAGAKDRGQASARRAFAVGAGDQRAAQRSVRCADPVEDGPGALGPQLHRKAALPRDEVQGISVGQESAALTFWIRSTAVRTVSYRHTAYPSAWLAGGRRLSAQPRLPRIPVRDVAGCRLQPLRRATPDTSP